MTPLGEKRVHEVGRGVVERSGAGWLGMSYSVWAYECQREDCERCGGVAL